MIRLFSATALMVLTLGLVAPAQAQFCPRARPRPRITIRFTIYRGCQHRHWAYFAWSRKFNCRCYFCPKAKAWFYWHPNKGNYYPLENIRRDPPPAVALPPGASTQPTPFNPSQLPPSPDETIPGGPPPVPGYGAVLPSRRFP